MSHPAFTSQLQSITALWPVLISRPAESSWPGWLATYRSGTPARRRPVTHPSTNLARRRVTWLIRPTTLAPHQTAILYVSIFHASLPDVSVIAPSDEEFGCDRVTIAGARRAARRPTPTDNSPRYFMLHLVRDGHETLESEMRPRRLSCVLRLETETSRPRPHPCILSPPSRTPITMTW